jgi:4-amino-4-deoxy-L-arabinose transferase-like glycosyltransferase
MKFLSTDRAFFLTHWRPGWLLITLAGLFFAFFGAGRPLWFDEICSAEIIRQWPWAELIELLRHDSGPPLYYVVLHYWVGLGGEGEGSLRALSGIFYLGSVVFTGLLARRFYGGDTNAGWWAAFLYAMSAMAIRHAQTARPYALAGLLVALSTWLLVRLLDKGGRSWPAWAGYAVVILIGLYTHYIFLFAVLGQCALVVTRYGWEMLGRMAVTGVGISLGYLPWLPILMEQSRNGGVDWMDRPSWALLTAGLLAPFGKGLAALGVVGMLAAPLAPLWSRRREIAVQWPLLAMVLCTLGTIWVVSYFKPLYLPSRSTILIMAPLMALLGGLWAQSTAGLLRTTMAGLLLAGTLFGFVRYVRGPAGEDSGPALRQIVAEGKPGDLILCTGLTYWPANYGLRRLGAIGSRELVAYPNGILEHPGLLGKVAVEVGETGLQQEAERLVDRIEKQLRQHPETTVWMLYGYETHITERLRTLLDHRLRQTSRNAYAGNLFTELYSYRVVTPTPVADSPTSLPSASK